MRRIITIIIIILAIIALGGGIYLAWEKNKGILDSADYQTSQTNSVGEQLNLDVNSNVGKLKLISAFPVFDFWILGKADSSYDGEKIFYFGNDGKSWRVFEAGSDNSISGAEFNNLRQIKHSLDGNRIAIASGNSSLGPIDVFYANNNIFQTIPGENSSFDFSPDGNKLVYLEATSGGVDLLIKDFADAKQKTTKIISLNVSDYDVSWVDNDRIFLMPKSAFDFTGTVWEYNLKSKLLSKVTVGKGIMLNWSKMSSLGLKFYSTPERDYGLQLIDLSGKAVGNFKFKTFPDKCFVSSISQIYCAIPRSQEVFNSGVYPDDYLKRGVFFMDGIYQIDMNKNSFKAVFEENSPLIDAVNLQFSGNKLFFINRYDNMLYSLEI